MSNQQAVSPLTSIYEAYIRAGFALVPITQGKGPTGKGWNEKNKAVTRLDQIDGTVGYGLAHAYSTPITCALDIDSWTDAVPLLLQSGIDIQAMGYQADTVMIDSGNPGHAKFLFTLTEPLPTRKVSVSGRTIYELRCASANGRTVQDVLPSAISHPKTGQPYRWAGPGHFSKIPAAPDALLTLWKSFAIKESEKNIQSGDAVNASWTEIKSALEHISPDCSRDEWVHVGMALQWVGEQTGDLEYALQVWNDWSQPSDKYPGEGALIGQWGSFKADKVSTVKLGTLYRYAKNNGWVRPLPDATSLFSALPAPVTPNDLIAGLTVPPPDMDMSLWPSVLSIRADQVGENIGCDPLTPLMAGLAAVAGAVDARTRLELKKGFKVPPVVWLMTIGSPANKKSPGSKPMYQPLVTFGIEDEGNYVKRRLEWEGKEAAYSASKKAFLDFAASPEMLLSSDTAPTVIDLPPAPVKTRLTVTDITSQMLVRMAADRPRGLLCVLDEMHGWAKRMTDPKGGDDRSAWVVSYESDRYEMDRVGAGSIQCENLAVSIYGNIQPAVFAHFLPMLASDGMIQRFFPVILRDRHWGIGEDIPDYLSNEKQWEQTLRIVYSLPPMTYKLSPEAYDAFRDFQRWYADAKQDERLVFSSETFLTAFGKLEGTMGRVTLLFHLITEPLNPLVSVDTVNRVVKLMKSYVVPAYRYTLSEMGNDSFDRWVSDHVIHCADVGSLTMAEIKKSGRRQLDKYNTWQADQMVLGAMAALEKAHWVIRTDDGTREHQHHATWVIQPKLLEQFRDYRAKVIAAKQRTREHMYRLSPNQVKPVRGYDPEE